MDWPTDLARSAGVSVPVHHETRLGGGSSTSEGRRYFTASVTVRFTFGRWLIRVCRRLTFSLIEQ